LANAYLETGQFDKAVAEYNRILKLNPNYPLAHFHLAQAFEQQGLSGEARESYQHFLQIWKDADADIPELLKARNKFNDL
jgi:Tfp pilus assembly protein PilF